MADHVQITGIPPRIQYVANGSQTSFEYPFALFKSENMKVYLNDILQDSTTYTVSGAGTTGGGTVMFTTAPTQNTIVPLSVFWISNEQRIFKKAVPCVPVR